MREGATRVAINLSLLAVIILPFWLILFWLWTGVTDGFGGNDLWGAFVYNYLVLILPLLLGGLCHQLALVAVQRVVPSSRLRFAAVISLPIIPLVMSLVSVPLSVFSQAPIATYTIVSLVVYAYLLRLPSAGHSARSILDTRAGG